MALLNEFDGHVTETSRLIAFLRQYAEVAPCYDAGDDEERGKPQRVPGNTHREVAKRLLGGQKAPRALRRANREPSGLRESLLMQSGDVEENPGPAVVWHAQARAYERFETVVQAMVAYREALYAAQARVYLVMEAGLIAAAGVCWHRGIGSVACCLGAVALGLAYRIAEAIWKLKRAGVEENPGPKHRARTAPARGEEHRKMPAMQRCETGGVLTPTEAQPSEAGGLVLIEGQTHKMFCRICGTALVVEQRGLTLMHPKASRRDLEMVGMGLLAEDGLGRIPVTPPNTPENAQSCTPPPVPNYPAPLAPGMSSEPAGAVPTVPTTPAPVLPDETAGFSHPAEVDDRVADAVFADTGNWALREPVMAGMRRPMPLKAVTAAALLMQRVKLRAPKLWAPLEARAAREAAKRPLLDGHHLTPAQAPALAAQVVGRRGWFGLVADVLNGVHNPVVSALEWMGLKAPTQTAHVVETVEVLPCTRDSRLVGDRNVACTAQDLVVSHVDVSWEEGSRVAALRRVAATAAGVAGVLTANLTTGSVAGVCAAAAMVGAVVLWCPQVVEQHTSRVSYVPHALSSVLQEYRVGESSADVAKTVDAKLLRLATLPIPDKHALVLKTGTARMAALVAETTPGFLESAGPKRGPAVRVVLA
jgi:hypothetical protein